MESARKKFTLPLYIESMNWLSESVAPSYFVYLLQCIMGAVVPNFMPLINPVVLG